MALAGSTLLVACLISIASAVTYTGPAYGVDIPDCSVGLVSTIVVPDSGTITDVDVVVTADENVANGTFMGEISLFLTSPAGTVFNPDDFPCSDALHDFIYDDTGVAQVCPIDSPPTTVAPVGDVLSKFNGEDLAGSWTLQVCRPNGNCCDSSTMNGWSLNIAFAMGGGGDPHIVAPFLEPKFFELASYVHTTTNTRSSFSALLIDHDSLQVRGHVTAKPGTDRFYFTDFSVTSAFGDIISITNHNGHMEVVHNDFSLSCEEDSSQDSLATVGSLEVHGHCAPTHEDIVRTALPEFFPQHVDAVRSFISVANSDMRVNFLLVRREQTDQFAFYDYTVELLKSGVRVDGLMANHEATSLGRLRSAEIQPGSLEAIRLRKQVLLSHITLD